jgi:hypothetical protein
MTLKSANLRPDDAKSSGEPKPKLYDTRDTKLNLSGLEQASPFQ